MFPEIQNVLFTAGREVVQSVADNDVSSEEARHLWGWLLRHGLTLREVEHYREADAGEKYSDSDFVIARAGEEVFRIAAEDVPWLSAARPRATRG